MLEGPKCLYLSQLLWLEGRIKKKSLIDRFACSCDIFHWKAFFCSDSCVHIAAVRNMKKA